MQHFTVSTFTLKQLLMALGNDLGCANGFEDSKHPGRFQMTSIPPDLRVLLARNDVRCVILYTKLNSDATPTAFPVVSRLIVSCFQKYCDLSVSYLHSSLGVPARRWKCKTWNVCKKKRSCTSWPRPCRPSVWSYELHLSELRMHQVFTTIG